MLLIEYLADHMELAPLLARWHHEEWGALMPYWTRDDALAELQSHTARRGIPTTLVALDADRAPAGSVSLVVDDLREWEGRCTPWLASLYVHPARRNRGTGRALVDRAVEEARSLGVARLHVFAAGSQAFYERAGWTTLERVTLRGVTSAVMAIAP